MTTRSIRLLRMYENHDPPAPRNLNIRDIPGAIPDANTREFTREDYDGIHLGYAPRDFTNEPEFFEENPNITTQIQSNLKPYATNSPIRQKASIGIKTQNPDGKQLRKLTLMHTCLDGTGDSGILRTMSQYPELSKYKKELRYGKPMREEFDGHGKEDHIYKIWNKKPLNEKEGNLVESINYGEEHGRTAQETLNLHQNYVNIKDGTDKNKRDKELRVGQIIDNKFVENYGNFYNVDDTGDNNRFLGKLDRSRHFHSLINDPENKTKSIIKKKIATLDNVQPQSYIDPKDLVYEKEDILEIHDRLKNDIHNTIEKTKNLRDYELNANNNPFKVVRSQQNQFQQPQVPFQHHKAPPVNNTARHIIDGPYGNLDYKKINEEKINKLGIKDVLETHKKLNEVKFHSPDDLKVVTKCKKESDKVNNKTIDEHMGYSYDQMNNKLTESKKFMKPSPLSQSAKSMLLNKKDYDIKSSIVENVFKDNTDLKTQTTHVRYIYGEGYEPKFTYGPGTKDFTRIHLPYT